MGKIDTKVNKNQLENLSFEFPTSEKITIDRNSLHIQLSKFKEAITDSFSLDSFINFLITLSAVWVPMFTSDFKSVFGYSASLVKGGYLGFVILVTFYSISKFAIKPIWFSFFSKINATQDPEKMAQIILDKCNKKNIINYL